MANDKRQEPGSITKTSDAQQERISGISNVSNTITQMQKTTQRQIEETDESINYGQAPESSARQMNGVLSRFGETITAFTKGIQDISMSTARATKDAIGQYGKAIGQDINYNKQNMVAMALARTTPLFGYFAAKFMETDVFQKAKERMKESIAGAFKGIGSSVASIFRGKEKADGRKDPVPKMARGGYVEKGGMVEVHPAEVVIPIEKILARIDDSISAGREISEIAQKSQIRSLAKMSVFVEAERDKEPVGMVKGFLRAMRETHSQYEEPSNIRLLRAVLAIQDTMGATVSSWQQIYTKMLIEHPYFRQLAFVMKGVGTVFGIPYKLVYRFFKREGSYRSHLSNRSNPFEALNENVAVLYTGTMWRLDNIAKFTKMTAQTSRDLASFVTGNRYPKVTGIPIGGWSVFSLLRSGIGLISKPFAWLADKTKVGKYLNYALEKPFVNAWDKVFQRQAELRQLYNGEIDVQPINQIEQLIIDQKNKKLPPLITIDAGKAQEEVVDLLEGIDYHSETSAKELDKANKREKRKGVLGLFGMLGGGILNIAGLAMDFIKNLIPTNLLSMIAGLITGAVPTVLAGLVALGAGAAFGTWLDRYFFHPARMKSFKEIDILTQQIKAKNNLVKDKATKTVADETGMKRYDSAQILKLTGGISKLAEHQSGSAVTRKNRAHALGMAGKLAQEAVAESQSEYLLSNLHEYMNYDPETIEIMRRSFIGSPSEPHFTKKKWSFLGSQIDKGEVKAYGTKREAAFLKFLKDNATPLTAEQQAAVFSKHANLTEKGMKVAGDVKSWVAEKGKWAIDQTGQLVEKATGKVIQAKDIAKMQASDLTVASKLIGQEMQKRGMEGLQGLKTLGESVNQQLHQVSNVITQQASNVTSVYNSGVDKAGSFMDDLSKRVMAGNFH